MNSIPVSILSDEFKTDLFTGIKAVYSEAMEQARRDFAITKELMTPQEVQAYVSISNGTLTKWIEKGLPIYQIDQKRYIKKSELHDFILQHQI